MSAQAERTRLEAELAEANAELQDTYYDRSITDQQNALDQSLESFQEEKNQEIESLEEYLTNTELVVSDSLSTVQSNTDVVYNTLKSMAKEYSLSIAESITSPWKDGETAIQSYSEKFGLSMSSTVEELKKVANEYKEVMDLINNYGDKVVDQVNKNTETYQGGGKNNAKPGKVDEGKNESKQIKVGGRINAGNAKIYYYAGDKTGGKQYYTSDPIYTVLGIVGDWIKVRHKSLKTGVSGWFKRSDIKAYAKGTIGVPEDQLALIDELGDELIIRPQNGKIAYMTKGTGVVPADLTANLMEWGTIDPKDMLNRNRPQIGVSPSVVNNTTEIHIDASVGELIHVDTLNGNNLDEISKVVDKAWDKHMKEVNAQIRRRTR